MAEENTITTIFRANIDQFSASTQEMKRYMGQVNAEFADATAGLGRFSDSQDGLRAKLKQLDGTLAGQKKELEALESEYNKLTDEQKKNTAQGQKLTTSILKKRAEIKKTESEVGKYSDSLEELEKAGVQTRQELEKLTKATKENGEVSESVAGKIAKGLGKGILGLGTAVVGTAGSFLALGESTREFRKEQGKLETAFVSAGHSAETANKVYTEFNAVLGDTAKTTEAMQQLVQFAKTEQELTAYTDILTGAYATFGDALPTEGLAEGINHTIQLGEVQGTLADALEWSGVSVEDFNNQLANCNSEEERSALIQKTLNGLYGEASEHYKENNKDLIEAEKAQTRMTMAMAELGKIAEPIATMLKNAFSDLIEAITPFVQLIGEGLKGAFEGSSEGAQKFAEGISGIAKTLLEKVQSLLPTIIGLVASLVPSLIQVVLDAIPSLVETLANGVSQIATALGVMIPQIVSAVVSALPQIIQSLLNAIPLLFEASRQFWMSIVHALPEIIAQVVSMLPSLIQMIVDSLDSLIPMVLDGAIELFMALVDAIPIIIDALLPQIPKIVNSIIDGLLKLLPKLLQGAIKLLMAIVKAIPTIISALSREIPRIVQTIVTTLTSRIGDIISGAVQLLMGIIKAIPQICVELVKNMPQIISSIVSGLRDGIGSVFNVGVDLIKGLWEGIKSMASWIGDKIKGFGESILGGLKDFFGINSPSKLMEEVIGKNLALGIGEGFADEIGAVGDEMQTSLDKITPTLGIDGEALTAGGFAGMMNGDFIAKLADLIGAKTQIVNNNYDFAYKFEKMETSKLALHKAQIETKRAIGG